MLNGRAGRSRELRRKVTNMNTIKVRDIEIGAGAPKIIVPIVGVTKK